MPPEDNPKDEVQEEVLDPHATLEEPPQILPPEPQQAVNGEQPPQAPAPQPPAQEGITLPIQQFIQMQKQIAELKLIKSLAPLTMEARTQNVAKSCKSGHQIEAFPIKQTQQVSQNQFVEYVQTLVLCVNCGAALDQIRTPVPVDQLPGEDTKG
jgi:hypothetical protein